MGRARLRGFRCGGRGTRAAMIRGGLGYGTKPWLLHRCGHARIGRLARRQRDEALDVFRAEQAGQERHQFERLGEFCIAGIAALAEVCLQFQQAGAGEVQHQRIGSLVLRPGFSPCIGGVIQLQVTQVQLDARQPAIEQLLHAPVRRRHRARTPSLWSESRRRSGAGRSPLCQSCDPRRSSSRNPFRPILAHSLNVQVLPSSGVTPRLRRFMLIASGKPAHDESAPCACVSSERQDRTARCRCIAPKECGATNRAYLLLNRGFLFPDACVSSHFRGYSAAHTGGGLAKPRWHVVREAHLPVISFEASQ